LQEGVLRLAKKTNFILLLDSNRPGPRVEQGGCDAKHASTWKSLIFSTSLSYLTKQN